MEQREILSQALIPHKEGNKMLYSLLAEQFISLQEIPTSGDFAPSKTFYLFSVQMPSIARVVLQRCYKVIS
jgi:DNA-directed RNA polymerase III subunit RPC3